MRPKDIIIGKYYRLKDSPKYGFVKPVLILGPGESENTNRFIVVKCEHVVYKDDTTGFIRYFKPSDIIEDRRNIKID